MTTLTNVDVKTLGEALLEIKVMKSELSRLIETRNDTFKYLGEKPSDEYENLTAEIQKLGERLRKLKIKIEETNHKTLIDTPEGKLSMAETILLIGEWRAELANLEALRARFKKERSWSDDDPEKPEYKYQLPLKELLKRISELEKKKVRLDSFLSQYNWKIELID